MKRSLIVPFVLAITLASPSFAAMLDDAPAAPVGAKPNVSIIVGAGGEKLELAGAALNPSNPSDVIFTIGGQAQKIDAKFHNPTEADWFMQFLLQASGELVLTFSGRAGKAGNGVEKYAVSLPGAQTVSIQVKPVKDRDVTFDCDKSNLVPSVDLQPVSGKNLDDFADMMRASLEQRGYWFGPEGAKDRREHAQKVTCLGVAGQPAGASAKESDESLKPVAPVGSSQDPSAKSGAPTPNN